MPLLSEEPSLNPNDLFQQFSPSNENGLRWSALYVKARAEKAVARKLRAQCLSFFLPLYQHRLQNQGRVRISHLPVFPGYVFLLATDYARQKVLETNLVIRFLHVHDQDQLHGDLSRVHRLIEAGEPLTPVLHIQPGTRVEITHGALAGMQGKVIRDGKRLHLIIEVQLLQQGVSVEIDGRLIRPVQERFVASDNLVNCPA